VSERVEFNVMLRRRVFPTGHSSSARTAPMSVQRFELVRVKPPIKLAYERRQPDGWPHNGLTDYASMPAPSSPGNSYTELAISSLAVSEAISSTHCAYLLRDGQAE